uniref:Uncharacterized protein n=1 Tax=Arion vulgaris TaxID=1028688 RepID=A0A0B7A187_9EUPU
MVMSAISISFPDHNCISQTICLLITLCAYMAWYKNKVKWAVLNESKLLLSYITSLTYLEHIHYVALYVWLKAMVTALISIVRQEKVHFS